MWLTKCDDSNPSDGVHELAIATAEVGERERGLVRERGSERESGRASERSGQARPSLWTVYCELAWARREGPCGQPAHQSSEHCRLSTERRTVALSESTWIERREKPYYRLSPVSISAIRPQRSRVACGGCCLLLLDR